MAPTTDLAEQSFRRLQLHTLRVVGSTLALFLAVRLLFASPAAEGAMTVGRLLFVACGTLVAVVPTTETAGRYGVALVILLKVLNTVKSFAVAPTEVAILTAAFGLHRLLPYCVAVFGGARACVAMSLLASVDVVAVPLWRRSQLATGPFVWPTPDQIGNWYLDDREAAVVWTELNLIWIATGMAVAIVQTHHQATGQLVEALVSRQRFISNMVSEAPNESFTR